jgi:hypothetical protein
MDGYGITIPRGGDEQVKHFVASLMVKVGALYLSLMFFQ